MPEDEVEGQDSHVGQKGNEKEGSKRTYICYRIQIYRYNLIYDIYIDS